MKTQIWILLFAVMFISCDFSNKTDKDKPEEEIIDTSEVVTLEELGEKIEVEGEPELMIEYGVPFEGVRLNDTTFVFEGDIMIDASDTVMQPLEDGQKPPRTAAARTKNFWPNNTIYYTVNPNLYDASKKYVADAIAWLGANTNLKFVNEANSGGYIEFMPASGCYSSIGKTGRRQVIGLAPGCFTGSVMHEIMHAAGFWHEQSRADRDKNLKIHWANITPGTEHNFKTYAEQLWDGQDIGPHDFGSIMHYPSGAFSVNGRPTITKLDGSTFSVNRAKPSAQDVAAINKLYPKPAEPSPTVPPVPEYVNGQSYVIYGITVLRKDDKWYYYSKAYNGWWEVVLRGNVWYYARRS